LEPQGKNNLRKSNGRNYLLSKESSLIMGRIVKKELGSLPNPGPSPNLPFNLKE